MPTPGCATSTSVPRSSSATGSGRDRSRGEHQLVDRERLARLLDRASEGWPVAESNADAIRELAAQGVVAVSTAEPVALSVGLRTLLVHQYADVDDERVVADLERIGDLERFVRGVASWLEGQPG